MFARSTASQGVLRVVLAGVVVAVLGLTGCDDVTHLPPGSPNVSIAPFIWQKYPGPDCNAERAHWAVGTSLELDVVVQLSCIRSTHSWFGEYCDAWAAPPSLTVESSNEDVLLVTGSVGEHYSDHVYGTLVVTIVGAGAATVSVLADGELAASFEIIAEEPTELSAAVIRYNPLVESEDSYTAEEKLITGPVAVLREGVFDVETRIKGAEGRILCGAADLTAAVPAGVEVQGNAAWVNEQGFANGVIQVKVGTAAPAQLDVGLEALGLQASVQATVVEASEVIGMLASATTLPAEGTWNETTTGALEVTLRTNTNTVVGGRFEVTAVTGCLNWVNIVEGDLGRSRFSYYASCEDGEHAGMSIREAITAHTKEIQVR